MRLSVKICGMRDSANILAASALNPDILGFIFYPGSPRYAGENLNPDFLAQIPATIKKTGVFVNATTDTILKTVSIYSLDIVQLHGNEDSFQCTEIRNHGLQVIKALNIGDKKDFVICEGYLSCTDYLLLDTRSEKHGGSGKKFNWDLLDYYTFSHPFILSGGIGPGDAGKISAIKNKSFAGTDLNSRFETRPGIKDIGLLKSFIEQVRKNNTL